MKSLSAMVKQLEPMVGTKDLTAWEHNFVRNIVERSDHGKNTGKLTINQIARMEELYRKHLADAEPETKTT
jgi:hypothetical protein